MAKAVGGALSDDVYAGATSYGRFVGWMSGIIGIIIGLGLIGVGLYLVMNKNDPVPSSGMAKSTTGWIMFGSGIFVIMCSALLIFVVSRYEVAAAATGIGSAAGIISSMFSSS